MSIFAVDLLAWDRLAMLRHWAAYETVETRGKVYARLGVGWLVSFIFNAPTILLWDVVAKASVLDSGMCRPGYRPNRLFTVVQQFCSLFFPIAILGVLHGFIFVALRKRFQRISAVPEITSERVTTHRQSDAAGEVKSDGATTQRQSLAGDPRKANPFPAKQMALMEAGLFLSVVVTWGSFIVMNILYAACPQCVNMRMYWLCYWLVWIKPCLDPFLYAYASPGFRRNSLQLLAHVWPCTPSKR